MGVQSLSRLKKLTSVQTYLNSTEAIRSQEALTLCSDVSPAPLEQVHDGCPALLGVGVVLGEADPEQSQQNNQLHVSS